MKVRDFENLTNKYVKHEITKPIDLYLVFKKMYIRNLEKVCKGERI